jgi:exodeoxyribonuclease-3
MPVPIGPRPRSPFKTPVKLIEFRRPGCARGLWDRRQGRQCGSKRKMKKKPLKVASFNVNSIRARLGVVLGWLQSETPDVLCLQETKVPDGDFPRGQLREAKYHAAFRGEKGYNGVAILSRRPLEGVRIGFDEHQSQGTRLISAEVRGIPIVNTYVPQGLHPLSGQFREKLDWLQRLYVYFEDNFKPSEPLIWLGDFNVAPGPEDVYDPEFLRGQVGFHPDEQAQLMRFRQWGLVDLFRLHHPEPGHYTFWDYQIKKAVEKKKGWRIDHIWATKPLADRCAKAWIDVRPRLGEKPSDHTFVVAEFEI